MIRHASRDRSVGVLTLADMKVNQEAEVSHVHTDDRQVLQRIIAMGILSKTKITLLQNFPSYVFQIGQTRFAVDKELASCVYVRGSF